ncbi:hypothetical protein D3C79_768640 [compost metagenome]
MVIGVGFVDEAPPGRVERNDPWLGAVGDQVREALALTTGMAPLGNRRPEEVGDQALALGCIHRLGKAQSSTVVAGRGHAEVWRVRGRPVGRSQRTRSKPAHGADHTAAGMDLGAAALMLYFHAGDRAVLDDQRLRFAAQPQVCAVGKGCAGQAGDQRVPRGQARATVVANTVQCVARHQFQAMPQ